MQGVNFHKELKAKNTEPVKMTVDDMTRNLLFGLFVKHVVRSELLIDFFALRIIAYFFS